MNSLTLPFPWLPLIIFFSLTTHLAGAETTPFMIPRLSVRDPNTEQEPPVLGASNDADQTLFFNQTLDHFNYRPESYVTFRQRYVINSEHWGGGNVSAPILAYLGAEAAIDGSLTTIGFLKENAIRFDALTVFIEHRYYGQSIPFGSKEEAFSNASTFGYFNSAQALADYAAILIHLKNELHAHHSPVIVIGGSYGGMLASWFRLKYPHVALGALASSAPVLYFDNITPMNGYYSVVTKNFEEVSKSCVDTITNSWSEIDIIAAQPDGLSLLSQKFNTCSTLRYSTDLKYYLEAMYMRAAQYDSPPTYPVTKICRGIDGAPAGSDNLTRIFAGMVSYIGYKPCYITTNLTSGFSGWSWQTCSEMVMPLGRENDTMFQPRPFVLETFIERCTAKYGVPPRPHWVTSYYGGHDIKLVLSKFGSNIIFSNGLRDPYSIGGVLENISDSIVALPTKNGSHCLDLYLSSPSTDPQWLVDQRLAEVSIIDGWFIEYYNELNASK